MELSNPDWHLARSHRYVLVSLVDFYPQLRVAAETKGPTSLEIANLEKISLLWQIENGHTISLTSDRFSAKFDLEGSAKAIEKVRRCFAD